MTWFMEKSGLFGVEQQRRSTGILMFGCRYQNDTQHHESKHNRRDNPYYPTQQRRPFASFAHCAHYGGISAEQKK
jgi:hypothetical protein